MRNWLTTNGNWRWVAAAVGAVSVVAIIAIIIAASSSPDDTAAGGQTTTTAGTSTTGASTTTVSTTTIPEVDLVVAIDESLAPSIAEIPGVNPGDAPRSIGRSVLEDGSTADFVIGEVVVEVPDMDAVESLRAHPDVEVVDVDFDPEADPEDGVDVLVRARDIDSLNQAETAWRLTTVDPALTGTVTFDSEGTAATGIVLGRLYDEVSVQVGLNYVPEGHDIDEGRLLEGLEDNLNAFQWPFVQSTAAQGIGLDTAWQMLDFHGKAQNRVTVLVIDKGFVFTPDLPENARLRMADWGPDDTSVCGGNPCPYHGTQVSLTIAGWHDNLYGTAGVAGPWVQIIGMPYSDSYTTNRNARKVIKEERVDVVNMSYGGRATIYPDATKRQYEKTFRRAERWAQTVAFASAGNDGEDVDAGAPYYPCSVTRVVCVGGMDEDTTERHPNSNYGTEANNGSVEIYGPYCTYGFEDPAALDGVADQVCGTSFASPFVAGVAALLRVADPGLSENAIKEILFETAHVGGLGSEVTGYLRRIDAHMAVARALGVTWTPPVVEIDTESGSFPAEEVFSLSGSAESYVGEPVPLVWSSNIDGRLNQTPSFDPIGASLSPGDHTISATAVDRRGLGGSALITITVENEPPVVQILTPVDGQEIYEGTALTMTAYTLDPDIFVNAELPDDRVRWQIKEGSSVVWEATGDIVSTALDPGSYEIVLTGTDSFGVQRSDSVDIVVKQLEPGWQPPSAIVFEPPNDVSEGIGGGSRTYELRGSARGTNGNQIAGTRFKWTATADTGFSVDICVGSNFPGQGGGGGLIGALTDCKETSVDLGIAPGAVGRTVWTIRMEAVDNRGVPVEAIRTIELTFATG